MPSLRAAEGNVAEPQIANLGDVSDPAVKDTGFGINVTVQPNGLVHGRERAEQS